MKLPFLTASWHDLVVINFEVDPTTIRKYLPRGTELDFFDGKTYVSLVAFGFHENKLFGLIPTFPAYSFEEINLRFYVKKDTKRAVCFIKEVVPSKIIAITARTFYNEPYVALKTSSKKTVTENRIQYRYSWGHNLEHVIEVETEDAAKELLEGSVEEFILEHYWGYTAQADFGTVEYKVEHPRWKFRSVGRYTLSPEIRSFYGKDFEAVLSQKPASVLIAEGSAVSVSAAKRFFHPLNEAQPQGWVLYDGLCGFCSWWIPYWRKTIQKTGYDIAPVQSDWVKDRVSIHDDALNDDIRLLLNDGTLVNGADAYIYGMKKVWWSFPVGWLLGLPIFRALTWKFYKVFNRNRFLVSKICRLTPEI